MDVSGKVALITGGGTGVGRATALALADLGCSVAVNYSRSKDEAEQTAADVSAKGVRGIAVQADVARDADCRRLVETTVGELGSLHVLVQSAGVTSFIPHANLEDVKDEDWDKILSVNVKGKFQCARAAKPAMDAAGGGAMVLVSSVAGIAGVGSSIPYCASKAAVNSLTVTLARVLAPKIRVNAVAPGYVEGGMSRRRAQRPDGSIDEEAMERVREQVRKRVPLGRLSGPDDVAQAVLYLATDASRTTTGQVLHPNGGKPMVS